MKCGCCKGNHQTVAEVRDCYAIAEHEEAMAKAEQEAEARNERFFEEGSEAFQAARFAEEQEEALRLGGIDPWTAMKDVAARREAEQEELAYRRKVEEREAMEAAATLDRLAGQTAPELASDKQVKYALDLLNEKEWPDVITETDLRTMERRQVSKLIDGLQAAKRKTYEHDVADSVPAGRYALETQGGDNDLVFYQVDKPTEGKWAGRTFVKMLTGAPGRFKQTNIYGMRAARVVTRIAEDPQEASLRFGKETRQCGVCHSPLSNKKSRELGIGPDCRKKMGW